MKESRKTLMTKKVFREVLLELLQSKPLSKITITEICEKADLNRSTFYAHYVEVGDLLHEIENEMISNIPKVYGNNEHNSKTVKTAELEDFFDYVRENAFEFRVLLIDSDSNAFFENLKNAILEYYMSANNNRLGMDKEFQLIYSVNGAIGMMLEWIKREFPYDTKEFTKMVMENAKFIHA